MEEKYIVVVVSCEGIEIILGVFSKEEALEKTIFLKDNAPIKFDDNYEDYQESWLRTKALEKKLGLNYLREFSANQVCLMYPNEVNEFICTCKELPEEWQNESPWLY